MKVKRFVVSKPTQQRNSIFFDDISNNNHLLPCSSIIPQESSTNLSDCNELFDYTSDDPDVNPVKDTLKVPQKYKIKVPSIKIPNKISPESFSRSVSAISTLSVTNSMVSTLSTSCTTASPSIISSCNSTPASAYIISKSPAITSNIQAFNIINGKDNKYLMSSNGFQSGYHEWTIEIIKCDLLRQEIGIISNLDINVDIGNFGGIRENNEFGARSVYGNIPEMNSFYYASYNNNNTCRCNKPLSVFNSWSNDDKIKICLDLTKGSITFYLNDQKVRKSISLQKNIVYYPIISFSGHCKYKIISYNKS